MNYSIESDWVDPAMVVVSFRDAQRDNQLCWAAIDELGQTLKDHREQGARVIILASGLRGHWLEHAWLQDLIDGVEGRQQTGSGQGWFDVLAEVGHEDVVSIAAISGDCSGGGAEIGWACDLRIAEEQCRFAQPEVDLGLTTGIGGCSRLSRLAGRSTATEMVLTGKGAGAARLHDLGAINRLVAQGEALSEALRLGRELLEKSTPALRGLKAILGASDQQFLQQSLEHEQQVFQSIVVSEEALAGMKSVQAGYDAGKGKR